MGQEKTNFNLKIFASRKELKLRKYVTLPKWFILHTYRADTPKTKVTVSFCVVMNYNSSWMHDIVQYYTYMKAKIFFKL